MRMFVAFVAVSFLGCIRGRICLESVSGAQRFCLPGATGANLLLQRAVAGG
jgi:hypothetical protein